jgi:hypothetical protein
MIYTTRPLSDRTWLRPDRERKTSQFDATWTKTLTLLGREIELLGGRDIVIEVDVREQDIRLDGGLRANARASSPAVVVAFDTTKHGPMLYRADRYGDRWSNRPGWQENVRAVALTLESLRAVDRYGATETGQQYAGFKALPAGRAMPASHVTREQALATIARLSAELPGHYAHDHDMRRYAEHPDEIRRDWKKARALHHPDRHDGDRTLWDQVEQAAQVLGVSR